MAISANGMKHLLAHVPHQELANAWLQYLIDAEHKLRLFREATDRDELKDSHKKNYGAVIDRHGVKKGLSPTAISGLRKGTEQGRVQKRFPTELIRPMPRCRGPRG